MKLTDVGGNMAALVDTYSGQELRTSLDELTRAARAWGEGLFDTLELQHRELRTCEPYLTIKALFSEWSSGEAKPQDGST